MGVIGLKCLSNHFTKYPNMVALILINIINRFPLAEIVDIADIVFIDILLTSCKEFYSRQLVFKIV